MSADKLLVEEVICRLRCTLADPELQKRRGQIFS